MPLLKSSIKQNRQNAKNRLRNDTQKLGTRKAIKAVEKMVATKETKDLSVSVNKAAGMIDKMAKKNLIHKNTAARRKSKLMRLANSAK